MLVTRFAVWTGLGVASVVGLSAILLELVFLEAMIVKLVLSLFILQRIFAIIGHAVVLIKRLVLENFLVNFDFAYIVSHRSISQFLLLL